MRIYIREKTGRKFFIPVPLSIAGAACKIADFVCKRVDKHIDAQTKEILDCIDFNELAKSLRYLKGYKGLKLVEVKSQEGDEVTIIL
ncbi:hypothetical protein LGL08_16180 [Clostridium estertheticum]|uniref:hypothetical protein n=1 Tax=Clostridium estertheticum TaxID=238834 RepID=UPI001CF5E04A|nr:hypothetical protein [Clostridium estertheticum]MCB2307572.1 hypothetical protein [Clostridium estertheticum]MCB2347174.1 hypothetical protein [Clostridium estertheticum]MCB2351062.1 hypothetical protein [Clostridium estertheticum]WAG46720.1 hypothetical protein LL127_03990 [Clostridium estertheticum]